MSLYDDMRAEYDTPAEALEAMRAALGLPAEHLHCTCCAGNEGNEAGRGDWRTVNVRGRLVTLAIGAELDECGQFRIALMVDYKELCRFHVTAGEGA